MQSLIIRTPVPSAENRNTSFYDKYAESGNTEALYGASLIHMAIYAYPGAKNWMGAGAGSCVIVRYLDKIGLNSFGSEFSEYNVAKYCDDLRSRGRVVQSSIAQTSFQNHSFDVVTSFEVLEHIPEVDIPDSCERLARLTKGPLFLTISQSLSKLDDRNPIVYVTVKPREYWDRQFAAVGCTPYFFSA